MTNYPYPPELFTTFAFLGFLASMIPLPWHLEAWNTGTCLYMIWTGLGCLNLFINAIVWRDSAINYAPVWCDISSRITIAVSIAIPSASLCINRRLYHIASVRSVRITKAEKRRDVVVDLAIGLGFPLIYQICYYINQGHRFDIYENVGCWPFVWITWVSQLLMATPILVIGMVSAYYSIRSICKFNKSRNQFNEFLSNHTNLTSSRYLRLMCLASLEIVGTIPISIVLIVLNTRGLRQWKSWENTHMRFGRVDQYPAFIWRSREPANTLLELSRWMTVACAILFFAFFGFADEARNQYRRAISSLTKTLGISSFTLTSSSSGDVLSSDPVFKSNSRSGHKVRPGLPVNVHKELYNRESMLSMDVSFNDAGGLLGEKNDDSKSSTFAPTLSYGAMTLNDAGGTLSDVGGTLPDYSESPISPGPASSTLSPTPVMTRQNSTQNIEISSLRRESSTPISPVIDSATAEKAHSSDVV